MDKVALYFGCLDQPGHYLHGLRRLGMNRDTTIWPDKDLPGFPWRGSHLDSGLLSNRKVADEPTGRVFMTIGADLRPEVALDAVWLAFCWWDRSIDKRGGSNSGFYVCGFHHLQSHAAFDFAISQWPQVVKRQEFPLIMMEP